MIRIPATLCLSLVLLVLPSTLRVEGSKIFSPQCVSKDTRGGTSHSFAAQENSQTISLPQSKGSWLIEMTRDGGMRPSKHTVQINSDGEISVTSESYKQGRLTVDCSLKAKLSAEDLLKIKEGMRSARFSAWRESYDDPKHPVCCDQPTTHLTLHWRRQTGGAKASYKTSWYPGSSELRPVDLVEIATIGQALWNKTSEHCEAAARR